MNTDYGIEALDILLNKECVSERFFPLIAYKERLIAGLRLHGCRTKSDAEKLSDDVLRQIGPDDPDMIRLFRRFLTLYDVNPQKFREIEKATFDPDERAAFYELYHLPGVKQIRAALYDRSGYKSVRDFAAASVEEVLARTAQTISKENLSCVVPLPKEVRTQIAVARAFTGTDGAGKDGKTV